MSTLETLSYAIDWPTVGWVGFVAVSSVAGVFGGGEGSAEPGAGVNALQSSANPVTVPATEGSAMESTKTGAQRIGPASAGVIPGT